MDAISDPVCVSTIYHHPLAEQGIIFCSIGEAIQGYPELVRKTLSTVAPPNYTFFAALASEGNFVNMPKGMHCWMELTTYFIEDNPAAEHARRSADALCERRFQPAARENETISYKWLP